MPAGRDFQDATQAIRQFSDALEDASKNSKKAERSGRGAVSNTISVIGSTVELFRGMSPAILSFADSLNQLGVAFDIESIKGAGTALKELTNDVNRFGSVLTTSQSVASQAAQVLAPALAGNQPIEQIASQNAGLIRVLQHRAERSRQLQQVIAGQVFTQAAQDAGASSKTMEALRDMAGF